MMKKIDESYMKALEELHKSFVKARAAHTALAEEYETAKNELEGMPSNVPEWDHTAYAKKSAALARFTEAKNGLQGKVERVWGDYRQELATIRAALVDEIENADSLRAADIDPAAVTLLNAGIMKSRDYQKMAEQYSDNSAVLALVRKAAREYADSLRGGIDDGENARERLAALSVAENAITGSELAIQGFDGWVTAARTLAGQSENGSFLSMDRIRNPTGLSSWEGLLQSQGISFNEAD